MALTELAAAVPLGIMPGAGDPANYTLPQQPLHRCMFPGAAAYSTLHRATNPHEFELDGVTFLGTSGQNVDDVCRWGGGVGLWAGVGVVCWGAARSLPSTTSCFSPLPTHLPLLPPHPLAPGTLSWRTA